MAQTINLQKRIEAQGCESNCEGGPYSGQEESEQKPTQEFSPNSPRDTQDGWEIKAVLQNGRTSWACFSTREIAREGSSHKIHLSSGGYFQQRHPHQTILSLNFLSGIFPERNIREERGRKKFDSPPY